MARPPDYLQLNTLYTLYSNYDMNHSLAETKVQKEEGGESELKGEMANYP